MNPADQLYYYPHSMPLEQTAFDTIIQLTERLGISVAVVIAAFWYIMFLTKQSAKEREAWQARDELNDERLLTLVESSSDALLHVKVALEANTQAMREFIRYRST